MPDEIYKKLNILSIKPFLHSNITRVLVAIFLIAAYYLFLSPHIENIYMAVIGKAIRNTSTVEMNTLSPVFDIHVYSGKYNLNTQIEDNALISKTKFFTIDARIVAMNKFLSDYHSPMAQYSSVLISEADSYGLDWRLVASISGVESAFGNLIPSGSHNAWGWRGINKNAAGWSMFATWPDGIKEITRGLSQGYGIDLTPFDIEPSYCPPCAEGNAHAWAHGVTRFMNELDYYADNLDNL